MNKSGQKEKLYKRVWKARLSYLFIAPLMAGLLMFCYYPSVYGLGLSFFEKSSTVSMRFVGFNNFSALFRDKIFLNSIPVMLKIMLPRLAIAIVVPLVMAELIFGLRSHKSQNIYRIMILLPIVAPGVVSMLIWRNVLNSDYGLLTAITRGLGFVPKTETVEWLNNPKLVIYTIIFIGFPWIGGTAVLIYMSGLMNISAEVFEASRLDGASVMTRIFRIDLPLLLGQVRYFLIFGIIGGLQDYGTQYILTYGGPGYATYVPGYYMYQLAFRDDNMGYAAAIGAVLFLTAFIITLAAFRYLNIAGLKQAKEEKAG